MHRLVVAATFLVVFACNRTNPVTTGSSVTGAWGGDHAALTLHDSGGNIEYDCAHGGLTAALRPGADGAFDAPGFHVREHGGPISINEIVDSLPARFLGTVKGSEMTLRVRVGDDTLGPYALRRNTTARLMKCL